jgi:ketosteroid isomerase-like protein
MIKRSAIFGIVFVFISLVAVDPAIADKSDGKIKKEIVSVMDKQAKCWNDGNVDCYMEGYWKSDKLMFIGKSGLVYGWQKTLEKYKKNYPDKTAMGRLKLKLEHFEQLADTVFVIGTWELKRSKENLSGYYTLLWKNVDGKWLIVADHSS